MKAKYLEQAYSVLLPAFADSEINDTVRNLLDKGCRSILFGETRDEYVARKMSPEREAREAVETFRNITSDLIQEYGPCLIAVDQELGGIQRLEHLIEPLPSVREAESMDPQDLIEICQRNAEEAREIGINMFLAPVLDILTGDNPWLVGRTLGHRVESVVRIADAFVRGVQKAGVIATPKHYPGYPHVTGDPAISTATSEASLGDLEPILRAFSTVCDAGAKAMMLGPAIAGAIDAENPASLSSITVRKLKEETGFQGLVVSDDLDAQGVLLGRSLEEAAIASLGAGADLLLLTAGDHLHGIAAVIAAAVESGDLPGERLTNASDRVRSLANELI